MTTIWKTTIPVNMDTAQEANAQLTPRGSRRLHIGQQRGRIVIWWEVPDVTAEPVAHYFRLFPTGTEQVTEHLTYAGTVQLAGGDLVIHVYEDTSR